MHFAVSFFNHAKDNRPRRIDLTLETLERRLTERPGPARTANKTEVPAWSPAIFREGTTRSKSNTEAVSCLVLDYDDGTRWPVASARWDDWRHTVHSSWSHDAEKHKFRIVLPLAHPVAAKDWPRVFAWAFERDPRIDPKCKDASRIYFLPCLRNAEAPWVGYVEKAPDLLDIRKLELPVLEKRRPRRSRPYVEAFDREARQENQDRLNNDPGTRLNAAGSLGARLVGGGASHKATCVPCPDCGRESVWFWIDPQKASKARCNHVNSCGYEGWLDQLLGVTWT